MSSYFESTYLVAVLYSYHLLLNTLVIEIKIKPKKINKQNETKENDWLIFLKFIYILIFKMHLKTESKFQKQIRQS